MALYEIVIWIGIVLFVAFLFASLAFYFQSDRFDVKYRKDIEVIRAIKKQKLMDYVSGFYSEEFGEARAKEELDSIKDREDFPSEGDFVALQQRLADSNKNLNRLMRKAADLKMWFDYSPRAKDFLTTAALWMFLLGCSTLVFCLTLWAEIVYYGDVRYSGYLSFLWIFMTIRLFKNVLRYNMVVKNINHHMDKLREQNTKDF
jgi:hypothetical protein